MAPRRTHPAAPAGLVFVVGFLVVFMVALAGCAGAADSAAPATGPVEAGSPSAAPLELPVWVPDPDNPFVPGSPIDDVLRVLGDIGRSSYPVEFFDLVPHYPGSISLYVLDPRVGDAMVAAARQAVGVSDEVSVEVVQVPFSRASLEGTTFALFDLARSWESSGVFVYSVAIEEDGTGLTAGTNDPRRAAELLGDQLADLPGGRLIRFELGTPVLPAAAVSLPGGVLGPDPGA